MSEPIVNINNTVEIETQTLQTLQTLQETKINKTPSYTLKAQKNYYNKKKDNPEFKNINNEKANTWINNNREKHNQNQVLYRQRKKQAKLLEEQNKI
jgi:hypothetical protein